MRKAADRVWIIGASAGIGRALAKLMAEKGHRVAVSARSEKDLDELRSSLAGEGHLAAAMDASDAVAVRKAHGIIAGEWGGIDRMVYMAGMYVPMRLGELDLDKTRQVIETNLLGAFSAVEAVLPAMVDRGGGQVALCASVAGYRGLPMGQPYGATKAGMINLAESLRAEHGGKVDVKVINPGFVRTRLTDKNRFRMPMIIEPEEAARHILKGLYSGAFEIHFPKAFTRSVKLLSWLPDWAYFRIVRPKGRS